MSRQVKGNDAVPAISEGLGERTHLRTPAVPAVHEQYRRAALPHVYRQWPICMFHYILARAVQPAKFACRFTKTPRLEPKPVSGVDSNSWQEASDGLEVKPKHSQ